MKPILIYRRRLNVRSGAGQLIRWQADGLRAAGARVSLACRRGAWRYFLRTGWPVRRLSGRSIGAPDERRSQHFLIDHEMELPQAELIFAHVLIAEAIRLQSRPDWAELLAREVRFFAALDAAVPIVVCSELMKTALRAHYAISPERVLVHHPGYRCDAFDARRVPALRAEARDSLGLDSTAPLIGFVTSGDFQTRGLDIFLAAAEQIRQSVPDVRFLVVGSKRLPEWAAAHPLVASKQVLYLPKNGRPELWMSALDIFLYPSRFDAFGMVVAEAQALGIPVLTSQRVGAAECLPKAYLPWIIDVPDSERLAAHAVRLLADARARRILAAAGAAQAANFSRERYVTACVATILGQNV